jgi:hypothetical protein
LFEIDYKDVFDGRESFGEGDVNGVLLDVIISIGS